MSESTNPADLTLEDILSTIRRMQRGDDALAQAATAAGSASGEPTDSGVMPAARSGTAPTAAVTPAPDTSALSAPVPTPAASADPTDYRQPGAALGGTQDKRSLHGSPLTVGSPLGASASAAGALDPAAREQAGVQSDGPDRPNKQRADQDGQGLFPPAGQPNGTTPPPDIPRTQQDTRRLSAKTVPGVVPPPPAPALAATPSVASPTLAPSLAPAPSEAAPAAARAERSNRPAPDGEPSLDGFAQFGFQEPELPGGDGLALETNFTAPQGGRSDGADALGDTPSAGLAPSESDGLTSFAAFAPGAPSIGPGQTPEPTGDRSANPSGAPAAQVAPSGDRATELGAAPIPGADTDAGQPQAAAASKARSTARGPSAFARFFSPSRSSNDPAKGQADDAISPPPTPGSGSETPSSEAGPVEAAPTTPGRLFDDEPGTPEQTAPEYAAQPRETSDLEAGATRSYPSAGTTDDAPAARGREADPIKTDPIETDPIETGELETSQLDTGQFGTGKLETDQSENSDAERDDASLEQRVADPAMGATRAALKNADDGRPALSAASKPASEQMGEAPATAAALETVSVGDIGKQSFDDAIVTLLKPMLREWLDANMPRLVVQATRELNDPGALSRDRAAQTSETGPAPDTPSKLNGMDRG